MKVETIQEKTYRLGVSVLGATETFESLKDEPDFNEVCKLIAIAQAEALEEAVKRHSFVGADGHKYIDAGDLTNMAHDLRESAK